MSLSFKWFNPCLQEAATAALVHNKTATARLQSDTSRIIYAQTSDGYHFMSDVNLLKAYFVLTAADMIARDFK